MQARIYHGDLTPTTVARALIAHFNRGNLIAQQIGRGDQVVVQIATRRRPTSGGQTALTVTLNTISDGVSVQLGKQEWFGLAASMGTTALWALRNPISLLGRLDDIAQDLEHLKLTETVWEIIDGVARVAGATHELSERLRRLSCEYCDTANPVGEASCLACGAPLGEAQPGTCSNCGYVVIKTDTSCPNCGQPLKP